MAEKAKVPVSDEYLDREVSWWIDNSNEVVRTVLQQRRDVVVQITDEGLQLWVEAYRDPESEETADRDLSLTIAVALDLDCDPEAGTITGLEPGELIARAGQSFLGDPNGLAVEIR